MLFVPTLCGLVSALLFALPRAMGIAAEVGLNGKAAGLIWQVAHGRLLLLRIAAARPLLRPGANWPAMAGLPGDHS